MAAICSAIPEGSISVYYLNTFAGKRQLNVHGMPEKGQSVPKRDRGTCLVIQHYPYYLISKNICDNVILGYQMPFRCSRE